MVIKNEVQHPVTDARLRWLIIWFLDHQTDIPEYGKIELNLAKTKISPQITRNYQPVVVS